MPNFESAPKRQEDTGTVTNTDTFVDDTLASSSYKDSAFSSESDFSTDSTDATSSSAGGDSSSDSEATTVIADSTDSPDQQGDLPDITEFDVDSSDMTAHVAKLRKDLDSKSIAGLPEIKLDFAPPNESEDRSETAAVLPELSLTNSEHKRSTGLGEPPSDEKQTGEDTPPKEAPAKKEPSRKRRERKVIELEPVLSRTAPESDKTDEPREVPAAATMAYWNDRPKMSRKEVLESAEKHLADPDKLKSFKENIEKFETRSADDNITDLQKETFYAQVGNVLKASETGNKFYNGEQLQTIASDMVRHAADPGSVNQGVEPTCTTAAQESVLYKQEPNTMGEVVSEAALTGQYVTASGDTIKIPEKNLMPDKYKADTPKEKARSLASHIAQPLLINMKWNNQDSYPGQDTGKKGNLVYEEGHPKDHPGDPQSRIMDYSSDPPVPVTDTVYTVDPLSDHSDDNSPLISDVKIQPANAPLMFMDDLPEIYSDLKGNEGKLTTVNIAESEGVITPKSFEEFKNLFDTAARGEEGKPSFPMLLGVHANLEPFHSDLSQYTKRPDQSKQEQEQESTMHAHHAAAVFDYDPKTGMVTLENQWGPKADHTGDEGEKPKIHIKDLYRTFKGLTPEERKIINDSKPDTKPSPDDIIEGQQKFVDEISQDEDQDPVKVWQERFELHRRLNHFGREEEAAKQREILARDYEKIAKEKDFGTTIAVGEKLMRTLKDAGEGDQANEIIKQIDTRLMDSVGNKPTRDSGADFKKVLSLHRSNDDEEGGKELARRYMETATGDNSQLDLTNSKDRDLVFGTMNTINTAYGAEATDPYFDKIMEDFRSFEKEKGATDTDVIDMKSDIMFESLSMGNKDLATSLSDEMQKTYDGLNKGIDTQEKFEAEDIDELRTSLRYYYQSTRQQEKLSPIVDDYMQYHNELSRGEDGNPLDPEREDMVDIYRYFGKELRDGGALEQSTKYIERSLELARKHESSSTDRIASELVRNYLRQDRDQEAQKLIDEFELIGYRSRRSRSR